MINRRLIRIKILQEVYAYDKRGDGNAVLSEKELFLSLDKSFELYLYFIQLLKDIKFQVDLKIDQIKNRQIKAADEEWEKYIRLQNNRVLIKISENQDLEKCLRNNKITWGADSKLAKEYLKIILESTEYSKYLEKEDSIGTDRKFLVAFCEDILLDSEKIYDELEERSIFWNDEEDFIVSMLVKNIKQCKSDDEPFKYYKSAIKDEEDVEYTKRLFRKALANIHQHDEFLKSQIDNWDIERVAELDLLIIKLALIEAIEFPSIPTKVTLNEFLDISKKYSTEKSSTFVNGILDKIFKKYVEENVIIKKGRGLLE